MLLVFQFYSEIINDLKTILFYFQFFNNILKLNCSKQKASFLNIILDLFSSKLFFIQTIKILINTSFKIEQK
jgi:hypothetical protein